MFMCCSCVCVCICRGFQFPADMYLEPEYWSETGCLNATEQHEFDVVKNGLYMITPKKGVLNPGERVIVRCSYRHSTLGLSQLPVLLKINRGREIMVSVCLEEPCIIRVYCSLISLDQPHQSTVHLLHTFLLCMSLLQFLLMFSLIKFNTLGSLTLETLLELTP